MNWPFRIARTAAAAFVAALALYSAPAAAQATRTWVSGVGDDVNPCSRTAPCKTFAGAISKTAAGGEINCIDPGGFGAVTITKSISILCEDVEAGVLVSGTNAIIVNAGANDVVVLRGLDIEGVGTGINGIRFLAGQALHVLDCTISDFRTTNGWGIAFTPSGASKLYVENSSLINNGNGTTGGGILIQPQGAGGSARVLIDGVHMQGNANAAMQVDTTPSTGAGAFISVTNSHLAGSTNGLSVQGPTGAAFAIIYVGQSEIFDNSGTGLLAVGPQIRVAATGNTITGNGTGVSASGGGTISSFADNVLHRNNVDGAFNATIAKQ